MMKVEPAEADLERLRPHLKQVFDDATRLRWENAAGLGNRNPEFQDGIAKAIIRFLTGNIAARYPVKPTDRNSLKRDLQRTYKVIILLQKACRLYGKSVPPYLEKTLLRAKEHEAFIEQTIEPIRLLKRGKRRYSAFSKFVCAIASQYHFASGNHAVVAYKEWTSNQYSGPVADLIEAVFKTASTIWEKSGLGLTLAAPVTKNSRLEYARKELQSLRRRLQR
jgi:hypothetical protein